MIDPETRLLCVALSLFRLIFPAIRIMNSQLYHYLLLLLMMVVVVVVHQPIHALYLTTKTSDMVESINNIEQCYFHINGQAKTDKTIFYGQCMSMNGPDGCCLEGHYQPGVCSNLGHICCTNPDPECNAMRNNKGITKSILKQYRNMLMDSDKNTNDNGQNRAIRSNETPRFYKQYKYRTNFEIIEMPAHMQLDAVTFVVDALDRFNGDFDDAADYLCRMLDQKYPEPNPWACTIGKDFGYSVEPSPGKYMLFYIANDVRVMAFVSKYNNN